VDPDEAVEEYAAIVNDHPSWVAARMFLAAGRAVQAEENANASLAEQAVTDARICETLAPRSPFVWTACLYVYLVALDLDATEDRESLFRSAERLTDLLESKPTFRLAAECRAQFLRHHANDLNGALAAFEAMSESVHDTVYVYSYAATAYQKGDSKAREVLSRLQRSKSSLADAAAAMLSATLDESPWPCRDDEGDPLVVLHHCWAHLLAGEESIAKQMANRFLQRETAYVTHGLYKPDRYVNQIFRFIGNPKDSGILSELKKRREIDLHAACDIDFTLAMYAVANGSRDEASRILDRVSVMHPHWLFSRSWAMALEKRWDDNDPESLRVDSDAVPHAGTLDSEEKEF
jgi:hypothetical protein